MSEFFDKNLIGLKPYTPGEQPQGMKNIIKLNTNENPFAPSRKVLQAISEGEKSKLNLYPDPTCKELIGAIADYYGVACENVTVGNGSDEILAFCFLAFGEHGICYNDITYGFYKVFAEIFKKKSIIVPLFDDFTIKIENFKNIKQTVLIANPNAPTGLALSLDQIEKIAMQNKDRLLIVDEAYVDFGAESAVSLIEKHDNILVVQTFSKSRNLAGARLGFAIGSKEIIADLNKVKYSFNPYNVNRLTLTAGTAAIKDGEYFEKCRQTVMENREYLLQELKKLNFYVLDGKANFLFAEHKKVSGKKIAEKLREKEIIVRRFDEDRIDNFLRITIGTKNQINSLIKALEEITGEQI